MPLYEYKCKKCEKISEILQRNNEKVVCPECGSKSLEKQFSVFASSSAPESSAAGGGIPPSSPGSCGTGCCGMSGH
ncbi:regulatory protein, FmdB family [Candidatus Scalindua japonica]|uniref:Regulatory protein, FmdB family n=1 Tax=Candidatus Scalindua japonica TaxID=1284222 RepID=A0A286TVE4_9BACT|nr:zinc ribbon domain-containing protein [Candidatus Scalindua japonica]GAX59824.1 regulatory protein, FmdB family [Candidatus Scalindua japonica]